jgi:hypothetical protein
MWNSIKSHAAFCWIAFAQDIQRWRWYRKVSTTYARLNKVIAFLFGGGLVSLIVIYLLIPHGASFSNNKRWVAIVILSAVVLFLLYLIGAIKRFHESTIDELTARHQTEVSSWRGHADTVFRLSFTYGLAQQAQHTIHFFRRAMPKDELQYLDANINSSIHNTLGTAARDSHYEQMPPLPDKEALQDGWINSHCWRLEKLIERERHAQLTAHKGETQKQLT